MWTVAMDGQASTGEPFDYLLSCRVQGGMSFVILNRVLL